MNCRQAHAQMYEYLDHENSMLRRLRVRWHLYRCPPCGKGFSFEHALHLRVRDGCHEELPEELSQRLRALLREEAGEQG